jgi:putative ABC transport system permease protein
MLRHLSKLIWNKKKAHALLLVEIWASFLVLFGLATLLVVNIRNYRQPIGFAYENVWAVNLDSNQDTVDIAQKLKLVEQRVRTYPEVESISRMSANFPFSANQMNNMVAHGEQKLLADFYVTDEHFARTLQMPLTDGTWYRAADSVGKYTPVVINERAKDGLFKNENPRGKILNERFKVVGVVSTFKSKGEFMKDGPAVFELMTAEDSWNRTLLIRVKPGTAAVFEAKLVRAITSQLKDWSVEVDYLTDSRKNQHNLTLVPVIIFSIVCTFLLINVALGLFGVLNLSIAKRRSEIGVRRAMGATAGSITRQFVGEIWVLATFGLLLGLILAVQFPLLNAFDLEAGVYLTAMALSALVIYVLVTLCALYPSRQAAQVQPSVALHEE